MTLLRYAEEVQIQVLYFGILKDLSGYSQESLHVEPATRVHDLVRDLQQRSSNPLEGAHPIWRSIAIAVNREYASPQTELHEGDEVALLPPVSGGCCAH